MRGYDIEFDNFEKALYGNANVVSTGGDLVVLALGAVGATTGGAEAKAALSAASGAVAGAQAAISKDLYYQRTIPALLAQMEADRANAKASLVLGIKQSDVLYPLAQAYIDLETLKAAGGIPRAIAGVTQAASTNAQVAQTQLALLRNTSFSTSSTTSLIRNWLYKGGVLVPSNQSALVNWMLHDTVDPVLANIPLSVFLRATTLEADRQRAITQLGIH
jgi:hypothetical protein